MSLAHPIIQTIIVMVFTIMWSCIAYDTNLFQLAINGTIAYWSGYSIRRVILNIQQKYPAPSDVVYAKYGYPILQVINYYISLYIVNLQDARMDSFF